MHYYQSQGTLAVRECVSSVTVLLSASASCVPKCMPYLALRCVPLADQGGKIYLPGDAEVAECSHVVASNSAHPAAVRARDRGLALVSLLWLSDCLKAKRLLPHSGEPVRYAYFTLCMLYCNSPRGGKI